MGGTWGTWGTSGTCAAARQDLGPADPLPLLQHLLRHRATNRTTSLKLIPQSKLLLHRVGHQLPLHLFSKRRQALHRSPRPRKTAENTQQVIADRKSVV